MLRQKPGLDILVTGEILLCLVAVMKPWIVFSSTHVTEGLVCHNGSRYLPPKQSAAPAHSQTALHPAVALPKLLLCCQHRLAVASMRSKLV